LLNAAIKDKLGQIQENLAPNPNAAPTSARVEHERLCALDQNPNAQATNLMIERLCFNELLLEYNS